MVSFLDYVEGTEARMVLQTLHPAYVGKRVTNEDFKSLYPAKVDTFPATLAVHYTIYLGNFTCSRNNL